jgi:hypothetical protein
VETLGFCLFVVAFRFALIRQPQVPYCFYSADFMEIGWIRSPASHPFSCLVLLTSPDNSARRLRSNEKRALHLLDVDMGGGHLLTKHEIFCELHSKFWLHGWATSGFLESTEYLDYASSHIRSRDWIRLTIDDYSLQALQEACPSVFARMSKSRLKDEELVRESVARYLENWLRPGTRRGAWIDQNVDGKALMYFNEGLLVRARKTGVLFRKDDGALVHAKNVYLNRGGPIRTFYLEHKITGGFELLLTADIGRMVSMFRCAIAEQEK